MTCVLGDKRQQTTGSGTEPLALDQYLKDGLSAESSRRRRRTGEQSSRQRHNFLTVNRIPLTVAETSVAFEAAAIAFSDSCPAGNCRSHNATASTEGRL